MVYELDTSELFDEPPPVEFMREGANFRLSDGFLRVVLPDGFHSIASARQLADAVISDWKFQHSLLREGRAFEFRFRSAELTGEVHDAAAHEPELCTHAPDESGQILILSGRYPQALVMRSTPELHAALARLANAEIGFGEPLQSVAYLILTLAERQYKGRLLAAKALGVPVEVLRMVGQLSSIRGSPTTARKAPEGAMRELTTRERYWLARSSRYLLVQLALIQAGEMPPQRDMTAFGDLFGIG